ncbi:hypothetical protein U724_03845 [Pseudomonas chlororaphis subsp. aurantiaca PB-St2]|nr:hypothetical protein U724_03845 [Pseudomonas chlororaphis subsp. aurantiaca PB-St2]
MFDDLVKSLGHTYPEMIASGMYLPMEHQRVFLRCCDTMTVEPGVE